MTQTAYELRERGMGAKYALTQFTVEEFQKFWPNIEEMLDKLPHTWRHWTKDQMYNSVVNEMSQVWGIGPPPKATLILMTSINVYPAMRVMTVIWCAGTFDDEMIPLVDATFTNWARMNDCAEIEVRGRLGWESKLKQVGFKHEAAIWTKKVQRVNMN